MNEHPIRLSSERALDQWQDMIRKDAIALLRDDERRAEVASGQRRRLKPTTSS
jgi:hypothetical protein